MLIIITVILFIIYFKIYCILNGLQLHYSENKKYDDYIEDIPEPYEHNTEQTQQLLEPELKPKLLSLENNDDVYISITEEETSDDWLSL